MSGTATVLSAGGATVPSSGLYTATGIQQVQTLLNQVNTITVEVYGQNGVPPVPTVPAGSAGTYVLEVPNGTTLSGALNIPGGYGAVIFGEGTSGTVTGGDAHTTVVSAGDITYTGAAGEIVASSTISGATGSFNDSASGAVFDLGGGAYSVTASGADEAVRVDNSAVGTVIDASGTGDNIVLGDPSGSGGAAGAAAAGSGGPAYILHLTNSVPGGTVAVNTFGDLIDDAHGAGSTTISGISGSSTIFAANNDVYYGANAVTEFISSAGAQTVFGGTGNDTVFNTQGGSTVYNQGTGGGSIFVNSGGSDSTIFGAGAGAVFDNGGRTTLVMNTGNDVFVGLGGSDSIYGGNVVPTVFGGSNENAKIIGSHSAFVVALGNNGAYDASLATGGTNFFALSSTGNTTLSGAAQGTADTFNLVRSGGGTAHTITIDNWHAGDGLFLAGYATSDIQTMDQAILGGAKSFTLSDGTTVSFSGAAPTHAIGSAIF